MNEDTNDRSDEAQEALNQLQESFSNARALVERTRSLLTGLSEQDEPAAQFDAQSDGLMQPPTTRPS